MKSRIRKQWIMASGAVLMAFSGLVQAQDDESLGFLRDLWDDTTFNAVFRADAAYRTTKAQNPNNQTNMPFQDTLVPRQAYVPPSLSTGIVNNVIPNLIPGVDLGTPIANWQVPLPGVPGIPPFADSIRRSDRVGQDDLEMNYTVFRFTGEMDMRFSQNLRLNARLRALYDPTIYDEFNAHDLSGDQGGITGGGGDRYADTGKVNYYEAKGRNGRNINPLELAGRDY
ncbi:hypothetical protein DFR24_0015, partial [Panacagrimonas perspica]